MTDALERIRISFAAQPLMATLKAELVALEAGAVTLAMPEHDGMKQMHGFVHGGIITALADSAAGYAAMSLIPASRECLTVELKTNFLRPAAGRIEARGRVLRAGRSLLTTAADVYAGERHVATLLATMAAVELAEASPAA